MTAPAPASSLPMHERVRALCSHVASRPRRDVAPGTVRVTNPHARTCYMTYVRVEGPREAVLDYAASLAGSVIRSPHGDHPSLELVSIEHETADELTLLFAKTLYTGE